jgi:acetolactate synthase-1/2/3 large subunit
VELLSGGEMLIRALADEGVEFVFGYPGGAVLHIYDAIFQQDKVKHILVRHEQAAGHAADGYARVTGKTGVVLATSGPGATNTVTAIATAYMDSIPMVVLSGQVPSHLIGEDAFQETDMVGVSRPIVKHSFQVRKAEDIPGHGQEGFLYCRQRSSGPGGHRYSEGLHQSQRKVSLRVPRRRSRCARTTRPVAVMPARSSKAVDELVAAKRPMIYAGGGVVQGEASALLTEMARCLNYPVTNTLMGLGGLSRVRIASSLACSACTAVRSQHGHASQ